MTEIRLIDANALKEAIQGEWFVEPNATIFNYVFNIIDNAPTVESDNEISKLKRENEELKSEMLYCRENWKKAERLKGEWITVHYAREELNCPEKSMLDFVKCPFCETIHQGRHNFCSRCGADMRGKEE